MLGRLGCGDEEQQRDQRQERVATSVGRVLDRRRGGRAQRSRDESGVTAVEPSGEDVESDDAEHPGEQRRESQRPRRVTQDAGRRLREERVEDVVVRLCVVGDCDVRRCAHEVGVGRGLVVPHGHVELCDANREGEAHEDDEREQVRRLLVAERHPGAPDPAPDGRGELDDRDPERAVDAATRCADEQGGEAEHDGRRSQGDDDQTPAIRVDTRVAVDGCRIEPRADLLVGDERQGEQGECRAREHRHEDEAGYALAGTGCPIRRGVAAARGQSPRRCRRATA